mgnify:CR=1 FL=1
MISNLNIETDCGLLSLAFALPGLLLPAGSAQLGLRAALEIRATHPETGVLVLSQYVEEGYALALAQQTPVEVRRQDAVSFAEACVLVDWLESEKVEHVHAHFGTNSTTVAMLCHALGGPTYSFTVHGPDEFDRPRALRLRRRLVIPTRRRNTDRAQQWLQPCRLFLCFDHGPQLRSQSDGPESFFRMRFAIVSSPITCSRVSISRCSFASSLAAMAGFLPVVGA